MKQETEINQIFEMEGNTKYYSRGCPAIKDVENLPKINSACYCKLNVFNHLSDIPQSVVQKDLVEIRFKNTRKGYFQNVNKLDLKVDDFVAVEASPGHDIGIVSLTGDLVIQQIRKLGIKINNTEFKKVYRKAKPVDLDKWKEAISQEHPTMIKARSISSELKLNMKIGDVEYQGDKTKAIFYYIADERVDFRELIKILANEFKIRVEMKQIGARQEAGRIGGIGPCGRELCCASWVNNFVSVTTNSARYQDLSMNPLKLAGQCGKLKCCLNYELPSYLDSLEGFPSMDVPIETVKGRIVCQKRDIHRQIMWFTYADEQNSNFIPIPVEKVKWLHSLNKKGEKGPALDNLNSQESAPPVSLDYTNVVGQESITRFDKKENRSKKKNKKRYYGKQ